ncbi:MAG: endopeptidase La [bacterium]|nr:endopeptidase La [bacterium]
MNSYLPVLLLKDLIILPNQEIKIETTKNDVLIDISEKHHNNNILLVCPNDTLEEEPSISDLPTIGVIGIIKNSIDLPNGNVRITILGTTRVQIIKYEPLADNKAILMANVQASELPKCDIVTETALRRKLIKTLTNYINISHSISNSVLSQITQINDLNKLTDIVATFIPLSNEKKICYMNEVDPLKRANSLIYDISVEIEVCELDYKIEDTLREEMESNQREFILREKIKYIKKELGEDNDSKKLSNDYLNALDDLVVAPKIKTKILQEIKRLDYLPEGHPERAVVQSYLDTILSLPWNNVSNEELDIETVKKSLAKSHYGLEAIKNRILEYVAVKRRNPKVKNPVLCLVGAPGVGKTSISIAIAKALNREFYKLSVGGLNDVAELMGNRRTYLGSNMGKIMQAIKKSQVKNPVILIDEVDKMVKSYNGDPASALLEIVDPEQNYLFTDNYLEEPFDLSQVMFIMSANDIENIPPALFDRLEILEMASYTTEEKIDIAKKYLLPSIYKNFMINQRDIKFSDEVLREIILMYTKEAGLRELRRLLEKIIRKIILDYDDKELKLIVDEIMVSKYLGPKKFEEPQIAMESKTGLINGLAYTAYGGVVMEIECCLFEGKGEVITTGSLGNVITESVSVAISYIRSNRDYFKVNDYYFDNRDIHIHFLEGATPKDGPSAGVSITSAILSLLLNKEVSRDIAMTGEIGLNGEVLEVGGIKEKIIGAYNNGIKTVFIPNTNMKNLEEIPNYILNKIKIVGVNNYKEIFNKIFE